MQLDIGKWLNLFLSLPLQLVLMGLSLKFISTRSKLILRAVISEAGKDSNLI
jgi:hypothetical protein